MFMALPCKFIHTADIHLGSLLNVEKQMADFAVNNAFLKIIDYALNENVDFIIISGDLYDRDNKSLKANKFFSEQCKRLLDKNINIYIALGNHDGLSGSSEIFELPPNVFICDSDKCSIFEVKNKLGKVIARIYGQSYGGREESRKLYENYNAVKDEVVNIGILHTALETDNYRYAPCSLENLTKNNGISYWALGHIHKFKIIKESEPSIVYPGIPQGRDIGEEGIGGCVLVNYDEQGKINKEFLQTAEVVWKRIYLNINEEEQNAPENMSELINMIKLKAKLYLTSKGSERNTSDNDVQQYDNNIDKLEEFKENINGYAVRWIIEGRGRIKYMLDESEDNAEELIREELNQSLMEYNPYIYTEGIDIRIERPSASLDELSKNNDTFKEILEISSSCKSDEKLKKAVISTFGQVFETNYDDENINYLKLQLDKEGFEAILSKAENLIVESFLEDGGSS